MGSGHPSSPSRPAETGMGSLLESVRVLDLTRNLAGPYCTMILGDMGADVVKIERPDGGDDTRQWAPPSWNGVSTTYLSANRNKRSLAVDLDQPEGADIVRRLAATADVVVDSFKPGALERRGLSADQLIDENPRLVHCSITGFGARGPLQDVPGYDPVLQAHTGLMSMTGEADRPPVRIGVGLVDLGTGVWAAVGVVGALYERERTGRGSRLETSLYETSVSWLAYHLVGYLGAGVVPKRQGTRAPMVSPYEVFGTVDEDVFVAAPNDRLFRRLVDLLELEEVATDPRFLTNELRVANRDALRDELEAGFRRRSAAEWVPLLRGLGIPASEIRTVADVAEEEHMAALGMLMNIPSAQIPELRLPDMPISRDGARAARSLPPPALGEHTDEILSELGYEAEVVSDLRDRKVVA